MNNGEKTRATGIGRGEDAWFLNEEPDEGEKVQRERTKKAKTQPRKKLTRATAKAKPKAEAEAPQKRKKTTVELLPETLTNIAELQFLHRQNEGGRLPMWKILDEAVRELLEKKRK